MNEAQRTKQNLEYLESLGVSLDTPVAEEMVESAARRTTSFESLEASPDDTLETFHGVQETISRGDSLSLSQNDFLEAIIFPTKRPVAYVTETGYNDFDQPDWLFLNGSGPKEILGAAFPSIGRIECADKSSKYCGTGFFVGEDILLTNRHVAQMFVSGVGKRLRFMDFRGPFIDTEKYVYPTPGKILKIEEALMIHPYWDAAFLRVSGDLELFTPLTMLAEQPEGLIGKSVATVGYPAKDTRNDSAAQSLVFEGVYDRKRLQPGKVSHEKLSINSFQKTVDAMGHDCSTLGGNSGSCVLDIESGNVLGLHFAGIYKKHNFAVPAWELLSDKQVRDLGVKYTGSPAQEREWVTIWDNPLYKARPVPAEETLVPTGSPTGIVSAMTWFETIDDSGIASGFERDRVQTEDALINALGPEEAYEYIQDLEAELGSGAGEEGLFTKPDPELPHIILLHGIMGAHLANFGVFKNRYWLDFAELLKGNLAERLSLSPDGLKDLVDGVTLFPDGHIKLSYHKAARRWRKKGFVVHEFSYDWRKSVSLAAEELNARIRQVKNGSGKKVCLVGNSMGGLVISTYGNKFDDWSDYVEKVVLVGSPLGGSYAVPMAVTGQNKTLAKLSRFSRSDTLDEFRQFAAGIPGLIEMLPHPDLFPDANAFYAEANWPDEIFPKQKWLDHSRSLKDPLRTSPILKGATSLFVSLHHPTADLWTAEGKPGGNPSLGDGTVPTRSSLIDGVPAFKVDRVHGDMLNDPLVISGVVDLIKTGNPNLAKVTDQDLKGRNPAPETVEEIPSETLEATAEKIELGEFDRVDWLDLMQP
ncbi:MAG: hypothetical protein CMO55_12150 [Verrucomicrobiales bacterium]|nr:hypothetical protein [Verrucomicrobiales bacterium]